jgi:hypothetical protein
MQVQVAIVSLHQSGRVADTCCPLGQPMRRIISRRLRDQSLTDKGKIK